MPEQENTRKDLETLKMGVENDRMSFHLENTAKKCKGKKKSKAQMFDERKKTGEL